MASFVADVLATAGKLEKFNLHKNITEIRKEITKLEREVKHFMDENYVEFSAKLTRDVHLVKKTEQLLDEINILQGRINDQVKLELSGSTKELKNLSQSLKESTVSLQLSQQLICLHECIKSVKQTCKLRQYIETARTLKEMQSVLDNPHSLLQDLEIYAAIKDEYCHLYQSCLTELVKLLHDRICWDSDARDDKTVNSITIKTEYDDVQELIQALHIIDNLENDLRTFSATLTDYIISPIIHEYCSVYVVKQRAFTVEILRDNYEKKTPCYKAVLYNLKLLFKFLHQHLNLPIAADNETFLKKMQPHLLECLSHMLTTDCISHTIPTCNADLKNFEPVVEAINEFQNYLLEIGFLSKDQLFLSKYTNNIDKLFIDRICQDLLVKARNIMKKDLHDSVRYEPQEPPKLVNKVFENDQLNIEEKLNDMTFQLAKCQISKSAQETLELARTILDEARDSSDACAIRLFYTCRNVFEMYGGLVPEHHRKFLETIPQQVALFHNNCMYLAHHLLILIHEYRDTFSRNLQRLNLILADQVVVLRDVGSRCFLEHMKFQRNIIFDIIKDSGFSCLDQAPQLDSNTERALRQCIRQLELLKTVWVDVLPVNVYCKSLGCITNSMIDDLIMKVVAVEDIPVDVASELVTLFNMVVKRMPQVFPDPSKIQEHVRKWIKFLTLIKVLGASLKEIQVMWGKGKGPLAQEFTAPQVKQLIRALFQNTERRSNVLGTIR